jgi:hypothetical protein
MDMVEIKLLVFTGSTSCPHGRKVIENNEGSAFDSNVHLSRIALATIGWALD